MDLVSVIIPFYKKKFFIKETIFSVLKQTYKNLEIIIIYDDQNCDDLKFIKEIGTLDPRISIIINLKNLGAGNSRNVGITASKGSYIAFIDSDDIWKKDKIMNQINFMKNNNILACHTSYEIINLKNEIIGKRIARNFYNLNDLLKSCDIGLSTVMLSRKIFINKFKFPNLRTKEDFVFWLSLLRENVSIIGLDVKLTSWRKLNNSLSAPVLQKLVDGYKVYNKYMKFNFFKSIYYLFCLSFNYLRK
jgi:teichuronic acid biosynthesis glycosyltransferase TuaG